MADRFESYEEAQRETDEAYDKLHNYLKKCGLNPTQHRKVSRILEDLVDCEIETEKFCN